MAVSGTGDGRIKSRGFRTRIEDIDNADVPFSEDILEPLDFHLYEPGDYKTEAVDLSLVIDCTHPDYRGRSWSELKPLPGTLTSAVNDDRFIYQGLKRARDVVFKLEQNPENYLSNEKKAHWDFYCRNGQYYIGSGVDRTVAARYFFWLNNLPPIVHGVTVYQFGKRKVSPADQVQAPIKKTAFQRFKELFL